jgi:S-adenosylmethionine:tRNA ribosyltransferase-isomerase
LLLRRRDNRTWEALVGGKGVRPGTTLVVESRTETGTPVSVEVLELLPHGGRLIRFATEIESELPHLGSMPLPPYIHEQLSDQERYQTVYSRTQGSAAAPTAGLHFTPQLIEQLQTQGVAWTTVTLHVGLDTFRPVQVDDPEQHQMHSEWFELNESAATAINAAKAKGGRVVAVGTTTARVLETAAQWAERDGQLQLTACAGDTNIFIYPPYRFRTVDALITNFHLPKSTLLMMISAFAGRDHILAAYNEAVREKYRFFSFGDAMLLV